MDKIANNDRRNKPAYGLAEAARYMKLPVATLRSWVVGRPYSTTKGGRQFKPLIHPPVKKPPTLSFWNLVEAHVLRALRTDHRVSIGAVRKALTYAEDALQIDRLLLSKELRTEGGRVFLQRYGELVELSASGQLALRLVFEDHLKRVEWGEWMFPIRLYPYSSSESASLERTIAIDPAVAFGRPLLARAGVTTRTIAERIDAGESVAAVASDYDLREGEVEEAVLYERAA